MDLDQELAERLRKAEATATPIEPFAERVGTSDIERAYRIQHINTDHATAIGRRFCGRKIGLTAVAVQKQLGADEPDYGALFADMLIPSGGVLELNRLIAPRIEAEIALVLESGITEKGQRTDELSACVSYAVPALEIVDSRLGNWKIGIVDTIADNGASAKFVLGTMRHAIDQIDLSLCRMELRRNGETVSSGSGSASLGHPLHALAWLAEILIDHRRPLQAGDLVLTGALGPVAVLSPGDDFVASFDQLSDVSLRVR